MVVIRSNFTSSLHKRSFFFCWWQGSQDFLDFLFNDPSTHVERNHMAQALRILLAPLALEFALRDSAECTKPQVLLGRLAVEIMLKLLSFTSPSPSPFQLQSFHLQCRPLFVFSLFAFSFGGLHLSRVRSLIVRARVQLARTISAAPNCASRIISNRFGRLSSVPRCNSSFTCVFAPHSLSCSFAAHAHC
jgi:hypothetical protein